MKPRDVTSEELEKEMTEWEIPMILDVHAVWCGPCLLLKPELEQAAEKLEGRCRVLKLDSDEEQEMASKLKVYGLPTLLFMKDGEIKCKTEGAFPADKILELADEHLFGGPPAADPADDLFISETCS
ncbi:unnamed protein product [Discosporangium mesarthrocarpum]